jgi:U3 small nucleolar RNA-associated protein 3
LHTLETCLSLSDGEESEGEEVEGDVSEDAAPDLNEEELRLLRSFKEELAEELGELQKEAALANVIAKNTTEAPGARLLKKKRKDKEIGLDHDIEELHLLRSLKRKGLGDEEFAGELAEELAELHRAAALANGKAADARPPKKYKLSSTAESPNPSLPDFDLVEPVFKSSKPTRSLHSASEASDAFGEATSLQQADAMDKSARKKSLRFHTWKIESASARRKNARAHAAGGDDDLPYREREKEKKKKTNESKANVRGAGGDDLDGIEPSIPGERNGAKDYDSFGGDDSEDVDGYYELIERRSKEKKYAKKMDYDEARAAARYALPLFFPCF